MLYLIYGNDRETALKKARTLFDGLVRKRPDAVATILSDESITENKVSELLGGQGLFSQKTVSFLKYSLSSKENKLWILKMLKDVKESENIFIFLEEKLLKNELEKFKKYAEKIEECVPKNLSKKEDRPIVFSIADALERRDRKSAWRVYRQAVREGVVEENIIGTLFWKIKTLAGRRSGVYSSEEIKDMSSKIVSVYHNGRKEGAETGILLEKLILNI